MLGKQSHVSESETNNLSAGELWWCLFVSKKLKVSSFKFSFYVFFLQRSQEMGRTRQDGGEEAGLRCKTSQSLLGSDTAQVTSPVPRLSLV